MRAEIDRKEALWRLANALSEAIACDEPENHPLFATSDQLTSAFLPVTAKEQTESQILLDKIS